MIVIRRKGRCASDQGQKPEEKDGGNHACVKMCPVQSEGGKSGSCPACMYYGVVPANKWLRCSFSRANLGVVGNEMASEGGGSYRLPVGGELRGTLVRLVGSLG